MKRRRLIVLVTVALLVVGEAMAGPPRSYSPKDIAQICAKAEKGDAWEQCLLAMFHYWGRYGVKKDIAEAIKWWRKAADQGDAFAQRILGIRYEDGDGVPKDMAEAYKWTLLGADRSEGKTRAAELALRITPKQRAEGERRAREFLTTPPK